MLILCSSARDASDAKRVSAISAAPFHGRSPQFTDDEMKDNFNASRFHAVSVTSAFALPCT